MLKLIKSHSQDFADYVPSRRLQNKLRDFTFGESHSFAAFLGIVNTVSDRIAEWVRFYYSSHYHTFLAVAKNKGQIYI